MPELPGVNSLVELVKLGSLGFSTAIMIFTFLLLRKIIQSESFEGENLLIRCKEIRIYMVMSIFVILIGMFWELMDPKVTITLDISPQDIDGYAVKIGGQNIDIKKQNSIVVRNRYEVSVDLVRMDRRIINLNNKISSLENQVKGSENLIGDLKRAQLTNQIKDDKNNDEAGI
ncbi:hypothetical protein QUF90_04865 [Desulfococcaceae bacterium HSG9]|nr:hypothetical protein [Desulfococcaceae bacterium HSG9]